MAKKARRKKQVTPERFDGTELRLRAAVDHQRRSAATRFSIRWKTAPKPRRKWRKKTGASPRALTNSDERARRSRSSEERSTGQIFAHTRKRCLSYQQQAGNPRGVFGTIAPQLISRWLRLTDIVREGRPAVAVNQETEGTEFFSQLVENIIPMSYPLRKSSEII